MGQIYRKGHPRPLGQTIRVQARRKLMLPRLRQRDSTAPAPTPGVEITPQRGEHEGRGRRPGAVTGAPAFALWRGMYFTQLLSPSTRWSVSADWIRTSFQGRDVNEPVLKRTMTPAESE